MTEYILKRTNGAGYVSITGHKSSYTNSIRYIKIYNSKDDAARDSCVENEIPVPLETLFSR